VNSGQVIVK